MPADPETRLFRVLHKSAMLIVPPYGSEALLANVPEPIVVEIGAARDIAERIEHDPQPTHIAGFHRESSMNKVFDGEQVDIYGAYSDSQIL